MTRLLLCMFLLIAAVLPSVAHADYTIVLEQSSFTLAPFVSAGAVCSNTSTNRDLVRTEVLKEVARKYADFDVLVTSVIPTRGRFLLAQTSTVTPGGMMGQAWGMNSWYSSNANTSGDARLAVFPSVIATNPEVQGSDGTCDRIITFIANVYAHEIGHMVTLHHSHAWDDYPTDVTNGDVSGCGGIDNNSDGDFVDAGETYPVTGSDPDVSVHVMSTQGCSTSTGSDQASYNHTFSARSERWILTKELHARGWYDAFGDYIGGAHSDHLHGVLNSVGSNWWGLSETTGTSPWSIGSSATTITGLDADAIPLLNYTLSGDVDADGDADLLTGHPDDCSGTCNQVIWRVYKSDNTGGFTKITGTFTRGQTGDIFRFGDVTGDGKADLVRGQPGQSGTVDWFVSAGSSGATPLGAESASWGVRGAEVDWFVLARLSGQTGRRSLVWADPPGDVRLVNYPRCHDWSFTANAAQSGTSHTTTQVCGTPSPVNWSTASSTGSAFSSAVSALTTSVPSRNASWFLGDMTGDSVDDIASGIDSGFSTDYDWKRYTGSGSGTFGSPTTTSTNFIAGSYVRAADINGDALLDLLSSERPATVMGYSPCTQAMCTNSSTSLFFSTVDDVTARCSSTTGTAAVGQFQDIR